MQKSSKAMSDPHLRSDMSWEWTEMSHNATTDTCGFAKFGVKMLLQFTAVYNNAIQATITRAFNRLND